MRTACSTNQSDDDEAMRVDIGLGYRAAVFNAGLRGLYLFTGTPVEHTINRRRFKPIQVNRARRASAADADKA